MTNLILHMSSATAGPSTGLRVASTVASTRGNLRALGGVLLLVIVAGCGGDGSSTPTSSAKSGIGSAGGAVSEASGARVVIPGNALAAPTPIAVTQSSSGAPPLPAGVTALGPIYAFTPHGTSFAVPVTITVPFTSSVPQGATPVLYKTNATQSAWVPVSGATVNGTTMVGSVSGFSYATVATAPVTQIIPMKKSWQVDGYRLNDRRVILEPKDPKEASKCNDCQVLFITPDPKKPKEPDNCTGCDLEFNGDIGDPQPGVPGVTASSISYWLFSDEIGETFGSMTVAPHWNVPDPTSLITLHNTLTQTYTFKADQDHPALDFLVTILRLENFDSSGFAPNKKACPELPATPSAAQLDSCSYFMTASEATLSIKASSFAGPFYTAAGTVTINGTAKHWHRQIWMREDADHQLWSERDFNYSDDADGDGGRHAQNKLIGSKKISIPISELKKDDVFQVDITMETRAVNNLQSESYIGAFFRDPLQGAGVAGPGLKFEATGLTQIPARNDIPTTRPPLSCTTGVNPAAGVLQFTATAFVAPERADRAEIIVERTGGTAGPVSVRVATRDGSAKAGEDYEAVSTEVRFADGEGGQVLIEVPLLQDSVEEPDETVELALSDVGGCGKLGTHAAATLTILDDDHPLPPPNTFTIGGTVSGLAGTGLVVKDLISGGTATVSANGSFTLASPASVVDGTPYLVEITTQPTRPDQSCTLTNGTGTITHANVTNIAVKCVSSTPSGSLDPSFGTNGRATSTFGDSATVIDARMGMALQADGRILMVEGTSLLRFNSDGTADVSFGNKGLVTVSFGSGMSATVQDVAVQPDGKIIVGGFASSLTKFGSEDFAIARYNPDGSSDTSFGSGGRTLTDFFGSTDEGRRLRLLTSGKILLIGLATQVIPPASSTSLFAVARYNADGTIDTSFGSSGKAADAPGDPVARGRAVGLQIDDKIVVIGMTRLIQASFTQVGLVRYWGDGGTRPAGLRDDSFGPFGKGYNSSDLRLGGGGVQDVDAVVLADDSIRVALSAGVGTQFQFALAGFSRDGILAQAPVFTSFSSGNDFVKAMLLQSDGNIVLVGQSDNLGANADMAVARFLPTGARDTLFGTDGKLLIDFFGGFDGASAVVQQPDRKLVVGGFVQIGSEKGHIGLARIMP